ncbi:MAG: PQQ-binding-like beta-propeller repeat protein [Pirellulaceae bacterium]|nr:PQQ-binding-like beta-propeller repeat protein [Pirellulaceae bacterium]
MTHWCTCWRAVAIAIGLTVACSQTSSTAAADLSKIGKQIADLIPDQTGIVAVVEVNDLAPQTVLELAREHKLTVYFQSSQPQIAGSVRHAAEQAALLGKSVFVDQGTAMNIPLSHNLADAVYVGSAGEGQAVQQEVLRILRPHGKAIIGDRQLVKPPPPGMDDWSHPFHGPDNNTQSNDQLVRGEFQTQFIGYPQFSPMPEQSVVAGGRIYKAMGNIAHKANQNEMLNTLLCINAYNGSILWRNELPPGFMIHRNTMIAAADALYMGDHESCKVFDAITGQVRQQFSVPAELTDGPVWKWMAMQDDTLYALVGNHEVEIRTIRSDRPGIGHWPWGMWDGHDYNDPRTAFGHGRTLVALDRRSGKLLWHYRADDFLDARGMCMTGKRIYAYSPERFLICIDAVTGQPLWTNRDQELLEAIGPNEKAQHYVTGYATTTYLKCNQGQLFFAGPQRQRMVVASTEDGRLLWTNDVGNLQLVLRPEAIYAAGPQNTRGMLLDYKSGAEIASLPARRACTRATGCADSIFFRAHGGTVRIMAATETTSVSPRHIAPMRPPCQDGVLVSNGHLYWGPWMCGCELSLYGNIGLRPTDQPRETQRNLEQAAQSLAHHATAPSQLLAVQPGDWTTYQGSIDRSNRTMVEAPKQVGKQWSQQVIGYDLPTAPVAAGGLVFVADRSGAVRAWDRTGQSQWTTYTGGAIYYPPCIAHGRLYIGSADGKVYCLDAASGQPLWSYRVAPEDRRISVFGKLVSRWPVAGGVVVQGDRVYAAAGITHYDGTFVVALDALSGRPLAANDTSGRLSEHVESGVSLQGELSIVDGQLQFAGGGIYELARYDLQTLQCLNEPRHELSSQFRTAFYAWYPFYNRFVSLEHALPDGRVLSFGANYDGSEFDPLALEPERQLGVYGKSKKDLAGEYLRRRGKDAPPAHIWQDTQRTRLTAVAICSNALIACGHTEAQQNQSQLMAIDFATGQRLWSHPLPADAVKSGLAIDAGSNIFVTLENGQLLCFAGPSN